MNIITLKNINKTYGETVVLNDFNFDFSAGQFTCLLGASGSGKTTILRLIAGLEKPDSGEIIINGKTANKDGKQHVPPGARKIGFVFQNLALWPHLTVYQNVAFGLEPHKNQDARQKALQMIEHFGVSDQADKYPNQLSGGQQQLIAIARSLVVNPHIVLFDEPLASLDAKIKHKMRTVIKSLCREFAVTIIYVTHDHREAFFLADEIVVLNQGRIETAGNPREIKQSNNAFVREFIEL